MAAERAKTAKDECKGEPLRWRPVVNRARCEAKAACVQSCPYDVFEVGPIDPREYRALPLLARLKVWAHGKRTALLPREDACRACGLCVAACPEKAITLVRRED